MTLQPKVWKKQWEGEGGGGEKNKNSRIEKYVLVVNMKECNKIYCTVHSYLNVHRD